MLVVVRAGLCLKVALNIWCRCEVGAIAILDEDRASTRDGRFSSRIFRLRSLPLQCSIARYDQVLLGHRLRGYRILGECLIM